MPCEWFLLDDSDSGVSDQEVDWIADRLGIEPETVDLILAATMSASDDVCYAFDVQLRGAAALIVLMGLEHRLENSARDNNPFQQDGSTARVLDHMDALIGKPCQNWNAKRSFCSTRRSLTPKSTRTMGNCKSGFWNCARAGRTRQVCCGAAARMA